MMFYSQFANWINLLLLGSYMVNKSCAIKCYICDEEKQDSFPCSEFHAWDERFNKECEGTSNSCQISQRANDKKVLSRSCEKIKLDDCKVANFIEYCYCSKNLCNSLSPSDINDELEEIEEDFSEDSIEGSGTRNMDHESTTLGPHINEKSSVTEKTAVHLAKPVESNVIKNDQKYSSSCIILQSNVYVWASTLGMLYLVITKHY